MANYTQTTFFAPKDSLVSGNPAKLIRGADVDPELAAIAVAIATKYDSTNISGGQVPFGAGTASAPSISFAAALNTGLYLSAANQLGITANGSFEASFKGGMQLGAPTGGAKGIGTLNATGLYINGTALGTVTGFATPSGLATLAASAGAATTAIRSDANIAIDQTIAPTWSGIHTWSVTGKAIQITGSGSFIRIQDTGAAGSILELKATNLKAIINTNWTITATPMSLQINSVEAIGISTAGNVTIAAPSSGTALQTNAAVNGLGLEVLGGANTSGNYVAHIKGATGTGFSNGLYIEAGTNSSDTAFYVRSQTGAHNFLGITGDGSGYAGFNGSTQTLTWSATGNVTIATPSSGTSLTINVVNNVTGFDLNDGTEQLQFQTDASHNYYAGTLGNHSFLLFTNNTSRMQIAGAGNVTINAPSSGVGFAVTAVSGQYAQTIQGAGTSGNNFGLSISAGAGATDRGLLVQNSAASATFLSLFGDGHGTIGASATAGIQWTTAGVTTINSTSGTPLTVQANGTAIFEALGTTAPTVEGYGPTAAALVDMTPDTSTFTITYKDNAGANSLGTGTARWIKHGNQVTLFFPTISAATAAGTDFTATGLPAVIQPTRTQLIAGPTGAFQNNSAPTGNSEAVQVTAASGTITFWTNASSAGWTASGTKGIVQPFVVTYMLN